MGKGQGKWKCIWNRLLRSLQLQDGVLKQCQLSRARVGGKGEDACKVLGSELGTWWGLHACELLVLKAG